MSRFAQPFLFRLCMVCAYTRHRYQVSVYRTIGPLVFNLQTSTLSPWQSQYDRVLGIVYINLILGQDVSCGLISSWSMLMV